MIDTLVRERVIDFRPTNSLIKMVEKCG